MRILSWNVNGLRAVLKNTGKDLKGFLDGLQADIICLQEIKATRDQLDGSTYTAEGYNAYFSFCKIKGGYSGVVTFCRDAVTPIAAEEGLTGALSTQVDPIGHYPEWTAEGFSSEELSALDVEGRAILTEHRCHGEGGGGRVVVVNVYCPMVDYENRDSERMEYKLRFYNALQSRCSALHGANKLLIAVGDFNCSREAVDSAYVQDNPSLLECPSRTRKWMRQFVVSDPAQGNQQDADPLSLDSPEAQLVDTFRCLHPTEEKAYTCWSTITDARKTNFGTRIDYILVSPQLAGRVGRSEVWRDREGSDHCPVYAELSLQLATAEKPPSVCSNFFPECAGRQTKLSSFLSFKQKTGNNTSGVAMAAEPKDPAKRSTSSGSTGNRKRSSISKSTHPTKLRKGSQPTGKTPTLLSIFKKALPQAEHESEDLLSQVMGSDEPFSQDSPNEKVQVASQPSQLTEAWRSVFSGPPKPLLCKGHNEPCVLRTVKKVGPNRNKQFWVCARPGGSKEDPQARCDFFKWASKLGTKK